MESYQGPDKEDERLYWLMFPLSNILESGLAMMGECERKIFARFFDEYGYIKDGRILHLDGLTKGNTDNAWTDLEQGLVFNIYGAVTELTNGYSLPGTASAFSVRRQPPHKYPTIRMPLSRFVLNLP